MKFEKLIKEIQINSGLNQKDFSESIGINRDTFRGWTKKTPHYISREILETISYLYNVPVFKLFIAF